MLTPGLLTPDPGARRVQVKPERLAGWLAGFAERHGAVTWQSDASTLQLTAADGVRAWIEVPFPPLAGWVSGAEARSLVHHVDLGRRVGVLLVRRGGYAVGVFDGPELQLSKVGSSYVQGKTKAGGWSQQRYARRRANQATEAFAEAAEVVERLLLPHVDSLDAVVCGGDRQAIDAVLSGPQLAPLRELRTGPILQVGDPRQRTLLAAPGRYRLVQVTLSD